MNIFAVHYDPVEAAQSLRDNHVVKMVLESAQILCTVAHHYGLPAPYKPTHQDRPCFIWACQSHSNAEWLYHHAIALCSEYTHRYGRRHKSQNVIEAIGPAVIATLPLGPLTPFAQVMPDECRREDPVEGYRVYYRQHKLPAPYTNRQMPVWAAVG